MAFQDNFIRGSIFFLSRPVADLPIQPLVGLSNPKTPLAGQCVFVGPLFGRTYFMYVSLLIPRSTRPRPVLFPFFSSSRLTFTSSHLPAQPRPKQEPSKLHKSCIKDERDTPIRMDG
ncbi:hypothetical protein K443DRAFT_105218 [Laccaria amethystina LaAM-08-1]|uniref:Unplaced genomic scaffold K443scaffold_151, whole genome shotgun sequence n=1 Tax=Laccaria amethystina LaAM-08-1 TaxID=1095629 RepID=A0A0C9X8G5_9AGAR|nr:hypothetical protein K443DRAFT_105218 [Laccaria amethystina LaAM-08-1]